MLKCHDSRERDTYEDGCDLNKLLECKHIPSSLQKRINTSLRGLTGTRAVSTAVSKTWAEMMTKIQNRMTDKKATAYSISSQSLGVLTTLLKESFSQILEGGNSSSKPYKASGSTPGSCVPTSTPGESSTLWCVCGCERDPAEIWQTLRLRGCHELTHTAQHFRVCDHLCYNKTYHTNIETTVNNHSGWGTWKGKTT